MYIEEAGTKFSQGLHVEKQVKVAFNKNKNTIWALLLSLLALITTFQKNYHNNLLVVMSNETVRPYCHGYPLNDSPPFLPGFSLSLKDLSSKGSLRVSRIFPMFSINFRSAGKGPCIFLSLSLHLQTNNFMNESCLCCQGQLFQ